MVVDCYLVITKDDLMILHAGLYKRHVLLIEVAT